MNKIKIKSDKKTQIQPKISVDKYSRTEDLPDDWDQNTGNNPYLKKSFLSLIEKIVPSDKSYYVFRNAKGEIDTQFLINKTPDYNIGAFTPFNIPVKMNAVYFPFTLSKPGGRFGEETKEEAAKFLKSLKGYKIILNVNKSDTFDDFAQGLICPRCVLELKWKTFDEYLSSLRAGYRRRYKIALSKSKDLNFWILKNNQLEFTNEMYQLYLDIYNNADYKFGKVSIDFFRQNSFIILVLENENGVQGFAQLDKNNDELIFEFVGFKKKNTTIYDTYIRLLLEIIKYGIENGFTSIDFGQTTDDAKLKLGCKYEHLYALINHSNPVLNFFCKKITKHLQYKPLDEDKFHVFKESEN